VLVAPGRSVRSGKEEKIYPVPGNTSNCINIVKQYELTPNVRQQNDLSINGFATEADFDKRFLQCLKYFSCRQYNPSILI